MSAPKYFFTSTTFDPNTLSVASGYLVGTASVGFPSGVSSSTISAVVSVIQGHTLTAYNGLDGRGIDYFQVNITGSTVLADKLEIAFQARIRDMAPVPMDKDAFQDLRFAVMIEYA